MTQEAADAAEAAAIERHRTMRRLWARAARRAAR
jgi:hypothetical protein